MKKLQKFIFPFFIAICFVLLVYLIYDYTHVYRRILYCEMIENRDECMLFKAMLETYDSSVYGSDIFIEANGKISSQIDSLAREKNIDLDSEICLTFDHHALSDVDKKDNCTYFKIEKLINLEQNESIN